MTTDTKATYYDLNINGATVETRDIVRAVLERAGLEAYAASCLSDLLKRAIRLGAKPGTDITREVEKIHIEAGMLRDATVRPAPLSEAVAELRAVTERYRSAPDGPRFDALTVVSAAEPITDDDAEEAAPEALAGDAEFVRDLARAINSHSMENESDTPDFLLAQYLRATMSAFSFAVRKREEWYGGSLSTLSARIAELERELVLVRDEVSAQKLRGEAAEFSLTRVRNESSAQRERAEKAERERDSLESSLREMTSLRDEWMQGCNRLEDEVERWKTEKNEETERAMRAERERDEWRQVADDLDKTVYELTDRYRPRRQSEEPAPHGVPVLSWSYSEKKCGLGVWLWRMGENVAQDGTWTHQPLAPDRLVE